MVHAHLDQNVSFFINCILLTDSAARKKSYYFFWNMSLCSNKSKLSFTGTICSYLNNFYWPVLGIMIADSM